MTEIVERAAPAPDWLHTGPGTLAGRYLRMFWQPVALGEELAAGRAKPIRIMSEDFTLYRGDVGRAHAVAFRCAHRGTQLSTGWVEGDNLRCFYHGWVYGPDGQCVEQPAEPEPFCNRIRIRSYPVEEYLGLIFVYLGEGAPPEFPRYPEFEATPELVLAGAFLRESNLVTHLANIFDHAHIPFVHGFRSGYRAGQGHAEESDWGVAERIEEKDGRVRYSHFGMPNICELRPNLQGGRPGMQWGVPIDDRSHWNFHLRAGRTPEETAALRQDPGEDDPAVRALIREQTHAVLAGKLTVEEAMATQGRRANIIIQDNVAQAGQMAAGHHLNPQVAQMDAQQLLDPRAEHLGREDVGFMLIRTLWTRELRALAEGRPVKSWRHPGSQVWGTPLEVLAVPS
jgi:5,5'-dehydrodivanillate O-demethylase oxygenase subunit